MRKIELYRKVLVRVFPKEFSGGSYSGFRFCFFWDIVQQKPHIQKSTEYEDVYRKIMNNQHYT